MTGFWPALRRRRPLLLTHAHPHVTVQVCTDLSPTNKYSTIVPLTGVLLLSLIKEGLEDFKRCGPAPPPPPPPPRDPIHAPRGMLYHRHQADRVVNRSLKQVYRGGGWETLRCQDIAVGDVVRVDEGDECPADVVLVATSGASGLCYIETGACCGRAAVGMPIPS